MSLLAMATLKAKEEVHLKGLLAPPRFMQANKGYPPMHRLQALALM